MDNVSTMQDKELVALCKKGSQPAFSELYIRFKNRLKYLCKQLLKDEVGAEDIVQDIFLQIWETHDSLNPELSFWGYLHTLAQNRILNKFKQFDVHSRFARHIIMNGEDSTNLTEDTILENDYKKLLDELIEGLSSQQKAIFRFSRVQGLTYKEIAGLLNISVYTVGEYMSIALKKIKNQLMQYL
jgi:RNA polymerase sigma-70 factor (ECF subfamily)